jgi:hypothetical protein
VTESTTVQLVLLSNATNETTEILFEPWAQLLMLPSKSEYTLKIKCVDGKVSHGITYRRNGLVIYPIDGEFIELTGEEGVIREF